MGKVEEGVSIPAFSYGDISGSGDRDFSWIHAPSGDKDSLSGGDKSNIP